MNTDVQDEIQAQDDVLEDEIPLREEAASLLELTKNKVDNNGFTPCPSCTIPIHIQKNHCPNCNSNIAANNALLRESLRRLAEIQAELDGQHRGHVKNRVGDSKKPTFGQRFKRLFSGPEAPEEVTPPVTDPKGPRILDNVNDGDQLKVLENCDPWYKIKTRDGKTGWVYSTFLE